MKDAKMRFDSFVSHSLVSDCEKQKGLSGIVHKSDDTYRFVCLKPNKHIAVCIIAFVLLALLLLCCRFVFKKEL